MIASWDCVIVVSGEEEGQIRGIYQAVFKGRDEVPQAVEVIAFGGGRAVLNIAAIVHASMIIARYFVMDLIINPYWISAII